MTHLHHRAEAAPANYNYDLASYYPRLTSTEDSVWHYHTTDTGQGHRTMPQLAIPPRHFLISKLSSRTLPGWTLQIPSTIFFPYLKFTKANS
ncbi:hypothetical protein WAI453_000537 [Rhynchosporium graminicola]